MKDNEILNTGTSRSHGVGILIEHDVPGAWLADNWIADERMPNERGLEYGIKFIGWSSIPAKVTYNRIRNALKAPVFSEQPNFHYFYQNKAE